MPRLEKFGYSACHNLVLSHVGCVTQQMMTLMYQTVREKEKKNTGSHVGKNVKEALRHNCQALAQVCLASSVKYPIH